MTGLEDEQLDDLVSRIQVRTGQLTSAGRGYALDLHRSVALVVYLMRKNPTQAVAGAIFGVSQPTVSRRWDLLRPIIADVLEGSVPTPAEIAGKDATILVDGTLCPCWDWTVAPNLFSGKHHQAGHNIQIAATLKGDLVAVGPNPVPGARHDAVAFEASGLKDAITGLHTAADLGYIGVEGIDIVAHKTPPGGQLQPHQSAFNKTLSSFRAAVERAIAHLKTWRMLSEEGGRYRPPLHKFENTLKAIVGLFFFSAYE